MYEVTVIYDDKMEDTIICESKPTFDVDGGFVFVNCGKGQSLSLNVDNLFKVKVKYPIPTVMPNFKHSIDINYNTDTEDVELLFTPSTVDVSIEGEDDGFTPVILVKECDNVFRVINSTFLKSIKVTNYSEKDK